MVCIRKHWHGSCAMTLDRRVSSQPLLQARDIELQPVPFVKSSAQRRIQFREAHFGQNIADLKLALGYDFLNPRLRIGQQPPIKSD